MAEIRCSLPRLYAKKDLYALENIVREGYELSGVRILPRYDPALFSMDYIGEALCEASRIGIVCHGFFDRYELEGTGTASSFPSPSVRAD